MPKFLIEVSHGGTVAECARAIDVFLRAGSHFLTHADWGCKDGEHKAWIVLELDTKEEARNVVPSIFQAEAKVVQLNRFTRQDFDDLMQRHNA